MTTRSRDVQLVQTTFEMVVPIADTVATMFYDRFFILEPEARPLFNVDMATQRQKLMDTLALAVRGLDDPDSIYQILRDLGQRHVDYRVKAEQYPKMNASIVWALQESLGSNFTDEMRVAWERALEMLTDIMITAEAAARNQE